MRIAHFANVVRGIERQAVFEDETIGVGAGEVGATVEEAGRTFEPGKGKRFTRRDTVGHGERDVLVRGDVEAACGGLLDDVDNGGPGELRVDAVGGHAQLVGACAGGRWRGDVEIGFGLA